MPLQIGDFDADSAPMETMGTQLPVAASGATPAPTLFEERFVDPNTGEQKAVLQWFSTGAARLTLAEGQVPTLTSMTQLEGMGFMATTPEGTFQLSSQRSNGLVVHAWLGEQQLLTSKQFQEKVLTTAPQFGAPVPDGAAAGVTAAPLAGFAQAIPVTAPPSASTSLQLEANQPAFVPPIPKKGGAGKTIGIIVGVVLAGFFVLMLGAVITVSMLGRKVNATFNSISNTLPGYQEPTGPNANPGYIDPNAYPVQDPSAYPVQDPNAYPVQDPSAVQEPSAYPVQDPNAYPVQDPNAVSDGTGAFLTES